MTEAGKKLEILKKISEEEVLYYPYSENKGADQLRGDREADLRLCFRPSILLVFLCSGSYAYATWAVYQHPAEMIMLLAKTAESQVARYR